MCASHQAKEMHVNTLIPACSYSICVSVQCKHAEVCISSVSQENIAGRNALLQSALPDNYPAR